MEKKLKEIGLSENEAKLYIALIELGPSLAGQLSRRTGLHRRTVYDVIEMLIKKGMAGYIINNNRKVFSASNPKRIIEIIHEKENMIQSVVEELNIKYNRIKEKEETNFYRGKNGIKTVIEDQLNYDEILILGASKKAYEVFEYYFKWFDKIRKEKRIVTKIISSEREIFSKVKDAQVKYLPAKFSNPMAINIYGDKTAIILWASEPIAIVIKNSEITKGYKVYFELLWNIAKN